MADWSDRAEELLYDGESVEQGVDVGDSTVVVTSHRVLAFTPDGDGANFQQVDRPNVDGVTVASAGDSSFLRQGARAGLYGGLFLLAGLFLPLDSIIGGVGLPGSAGRLGLGGILGLFNTMLRLLRNLDDLMRMFGALLLLFAIVPMGVYLWSRDRALTITVAGEENAPITIPADDIESDIVVDQLRDAIFPPGVDPNAGSRLGDLLP